MIMPGTVLHFPVLDELYVKVDDDHDDTFFNLSDSTLTRLDLDTVAEAKNWVEYSTLSVFLISKGWTHGGGMS